MSTIWLVEHGDYEQASIAAAFTNEAAANEYAERTDGRVYETELHDEAIPPAPYWHFGASVLPDGRVERWDLQHEGDRGGMEPVDDHLNARDEPWDGHTQGHCGYHVSVFGSDRERTREAAEKAIARYVELCDGTCHGCGKTGPPWMERFQDLRTIDVVLVGGPMDGETQQHVCDTRWDPTPDGLILLHGTAPDGMTQSYYGPIKRDGERWVRPHISTRPVERASA